MCYFWPRLGKAVTEPHGLTAIMAIDAIDDLRLMDAGEAKAAHASVAAARLAARTAIGFRMRIRRPAPRETIGVGLRLSVALISRFIIPAAAAREETLAAEKSLRRVRSSSFGKRRSRPPTL